MAIALVLQLLFLSSPTSVEGQGSVSSAINVSLNVVEAEGFSITTTKIDEELGAYRIEVATTVTGGEQQSDARSYLLMTDLEPHAAMMVTLAGGWASIETADEMLARVYDVTDYDEDDVQLVLDWVKTDKAYAQMMSQ